MKRFIMTSVLALGLASSLSAQSVERDLAYGPRDRNTLDLYLPAGEGAAPVVMFIHGGRWFRNDKSQIELYGRIEALTGAGIAVASINHTYSSEALWPAQREDVLAALRFLTENGTELGIDPDHLAVWGQSSGAHLALWSALVDLESDAIEVDAVVSWYAPSNLSQLTEDRANDDVPGANERFPEPSPESQLIGVPVPENPEAADAASPERALAALEKDVPLPPFFLVHGDADQVVSPLQSVRLMEALQAHGTDVSLRIVASGGHGGDGFEAVVPEVVDFLRPILIPDR